MAETRARKIARRATKAVVADTITPAGELAVNAVKVYTSILNLPTSGNSVGDLGFVYKNANGDFGWDSLYIWVGNGENDYGGWYKVPIHAFNYNKDD